MKPSAALLAAGLLAAAALAAAQGSVDRSASAGAPSVESRGTVYRATLSGQNGVSWRWFVGPATVAALQPRVWAGPLTAPTRLHPSAGAPGQLPRLGHLPDEVL